MSANLPLFDPQPLQREPEAAAPPPSAVPTVPVARGLDVVRVLEHKAGPFRHLTGGVVEREYRVVEKPTGLYAEFLDGSPSRRLIGIDREFVEAMLRQKIWREVEA